MSQPKFCTKCQALWDESPIGAAVWSTQKMQAGKTMCNLCFNAFRQQLTDVSLGLKTFDFKNPNPRDYTAEYGFDVTRLPDTDVHEIPKGFMSVEEMHCEDMMVEYKRQGPGSAPLACSAEGFRCHSCCEWVRSKPRPFVGGPEPWNWWFCGSCKMTKTKPSEKVLRQQEDSKKIHKITEYMKR